MYSYMANQHDQNMNARLAALQHFIGLKSVDHSLLANSNTDRDGAHQPVDQPLLADSNAGHDQLVAKLLELAKPPPPKRIEQISNAALALHQRDEQIKQYIQNNDQQSSTITAIINAYKAKGLGLFMYDNIQKMQSSIWHQELEKFEQQYFDKIYENKDNHDLESQLTSIWPFSSNYTKTPIACNIVCQQANISKEGGLKINNHSLFPPASNNAGENYLGEHESKNHSDEQSQDDANTLFSQPCIKRLGLPDKGKSAFERDTLVENIVQQYHHFQSEHDQGDWQKKSQYWGISNEAHDQADSQKKRQYRDISNEEQTHVLISLCDDSVKTDDSDATYFIQSKQYFSSKNERQLIKTRIPLSQSRLVMTPTEQILSQKKCRKFIKKVGQTIREIKPHQEKENYTARLSIVKALQSKYNQLINPITRTTQDHQLKLASLQIALCHYLGWSYTVNCKSSKDRTGWVSSVAIALIAHCERRVLNKSSIELPRFYDENYEEPQPPTNNTKGNLELITVGEQFWQDARIAYKKNCAVSANMTPGCYGLKATDEFYYRLASSSALRIGWDLPPKYTRWLFLIPQTILFALALTPKLIQFCILTIVDVAIKVILPILSSIVGIITAGAIVPGKSFYNKQYHSLIKGAGCRPSPITYAFAFLATISLVIPFNIVVTLFSSILSTSSAINTLSDSFKNRLFSADVPERNKIQSYKDNIDNAKLNKV